MRGKGKCEGERQCQGRGGEGGDRCEGQTRGLRTQLGTNCIVDCISQNSGRDEHSKQRTNAQLPHALCTAHKVRTRGADGRTDGGWRGWGSMSSGSAGRWMRMPERPHGSSCDDVCTPTEPHHWLRVSGFIAPTRLLYMHTHLQMPLRQTAGSHQEGTASTQAQSHRTQSSTGWHTLLGRAGQSYWPGVCPDAAQSSVRLQVEEGAERRADSAWHRFVSTGAGKAGRQAAVCVVRGEDDTCPAWVGLRCIWQCHARCRTLQQGSILRHCHCTRSSVCGRRCGQRERGHGSGGSKRGTQVRRHRAACA